ncbi:heat-shock protein 70 [Plakobranchus ocellatus]|uniref:Heat-shock protein 70 n=1 Tax=Plakobranchus ocellatus TaxID=259542 RepID=A0AAV4B3C0_9GAST|nr:heat-shock protein 70 [Plakobranchus ocellatus]
MINLLKYDRKDFDNRLVTHFVQEFKRKHHKDLSTNSRALRRLRTACERAKRTLSSSSEASIEIDSLFEGIDYYTKVSRARFEELCGDLFRSTLQPVETALRDAKLDKGIPPAPRGVPQIEVTFDIDANGILNVSAQDKSTGKSENIIIKNDKGRLSQAEIDRMLAEADKYKEEDEKQRERVSARNQLESYVFSVKQALEAAEEKLSSKDKDIVLNACNETLSWLDNNSLADKEEYEHRLQELQKTSSSVMAKLHGQSQSQGQGPSHSQAHSGPTVEEVD